MRNFLTLPATVACLFALLSFSCTKTPLGGDDDKKNDSDSKLGQPIEVVDGKVRFYAAYTAESSLRLALGLPADDFSGCKMNVNGSDYTLQKDEDGNWYADVTAVSNNTYNAVLLTRSSGRWHGSSAYKDLVVPYSQFWSSTWQAFKDYPRYASYSEADGNLLRFKEAVALLDLRVSGEFSLSSVKVRAEGGEMIAGRGVWSASRSTLQMTDGVDFAVVNCTEDGRFVKSGGSPVSVPVIVNGSGLGSALEITLCTSDHRVMHTSINPGRLAPGSVLRHELTFTPDEGVVWFEGFDNFVWGGNIMGGSKTSGYAPDDARMGISGGTERDGYADAFTPTAYDNPGTGFIQSNTWADVSGKSLRTSHVMSDSYIVSRNISDWTYLFRCQEYQGVMAVGSGDGNKARGILQTGPMANISGMSDISVSFKFCFQDGVVDNLLFELINAGYITSFQVDGQPFDAALKYEAKAHLASIGRTKVSVPSSAAEPKTWHTVTLTATNATDGTFLYFAGEDPNTSGVHGFYIDDITVSAAPLARKGNLRLLYWNIQNGMWADQANNYKDFVAFVKRYDPDICVWCEAASIYKDNTNSAAASSSRFLPGGWASLAGRYGHNYCAVGGFRDNYPQEITSKYPITTLLKITDTDISGKPVAHGAAIQQVNVNGRLLNFVTCHMWPQAYGFGVATANRDASAAANEGDYYREFEMNYIVSHTVNSSEYASLSDWFLLGDLNSRSRLDNWYLGYPENDTRLLTQDVVLNNTELHDIIYEQYPAPQNYVSSTGGVARIDYVYASQALSEAVVNAVILGDKWAWPVTSTYVPSFMYPSDHRPILIDFNL